MPSSERLELRYIPLPQVVRWDRNPKKHDLGAICRAIEAHGFIDPPKFDPTLNGGDGGLLYGNGRSDALTAMHAQRRPPPRGIAVDDDGVWHLPVIFGVDAASQTAAEQAAVDHNNLTMAGGEYTALDMSRMWESEGYLALLHDLAEQGALPVTVDGDDLDTLLTELTRDTMPEPLEDAPVTVDEAQPTRCQLGDVWRVGPHIVVCGDSTDRATVERIVAGRTVKMVWADPPYGIDIVQGKGLGTVGGSKPFGSVGATRSKIDKKRMSKIVSPGRIIKANVYAPVAGDDSIDTAERAVTLYLEGFDEALHIWWGANNYAHILPPSTCWVVWDKENTGNFADAELAWTNDVGAVRVFRHMWNGMLRASEQGKRVHPTQKPIALCVWAFEKYGASGDCILDPFLGSGPSLKAAHQMGDGRGVIGFELSPHYVDHILDWAEQQGLPVERADA